MSANEAAGAERPAMADADDVTGRTRSPRAGPGAAASASHGPDGLPASIRAEEARHLVPVGARPPIRSQVVAAIRWIAGSLRRTAGSEAAWEQPGRWSYADESRTERSTGGRRERPDEPAGQEQPRQGSGTGTPAPSSR